MDETLPAWAMDIWEHDPSREPIPVGGSLPPDGLPWLTTTAGGGAWVVVAWADGETFLDPDETALPLRLKAHGAALARVAELEADVCKIVEMMSSNDLPFSLAGLSVVTGTRWLLDRVVALEAESSDLRGRLAAAETARDDARDDLRAAVADCTILRRALFGAEADRDRLALELAQARDLSASMVAILEAYPVETIALWRGRAERAEAELERLRSAQSDAYEAKHAWGLTAEPDVADGSVAVADLMARR